MVEETKIDKKMQAVKSLHDRILSVDDQKTETLYIPEWDLTIGIRSLTGKDRAKLSQMVTFNVDGHMDNDATSADTVIIAAFDPETGNPIFTSSEKEALLLKHTGALELIAENVNRLSGISSATANKVKQAEKN